MGYAWSKKYKVLNISVVTQQGESQADHIRTKLKEISPAILTYCGTFLCFSLAWKPKKAHEKIRLSIQIVPPSPKNKKGVQLSESPSDKLRGGLLFNTKTHAPIQN